MVKGRVFEIRVPNRETVGVRRMCGREYTRVCHLKTLNMFYLVIYWKQKVHNEFIFLCSVVLPTVGHSSNHEFNI